MSHSFLPNLLAVSLTGGGRAHHPQSGTDVGRRRDMATLSNAISPLVGKLEHLSLSTFLAIDMPTPRRAITRHSDTLQSLVIDGRRLG